MLTALRKRAAAWLMSTYIDADAFVRWERGTFDLAAFMAQRPDALRQFPQAELQPSLHCAERRVRGRGDLALA